MPVRGRADEADGLLFGWAPEDGRGILLFTGNPGFTLLGRFEEAVVVVADTCLLLGVVVVVVSLVGDTPRLMFKLLL